MALLDGAVIQTLGVLVGRHADTSSLKLSDHEARKPGNWLVRRATSDSLSGLGHQRKRFR
jgi:hypothetical protein